MRVRAGHFHIRLARGPSSVAYRGHAPGYPPESFRVLDAVEARWVKTIAAIEHEIAGDRAAPKLKRGEAVPEMELPTAAGETWRLSAQRGTHILLVVLRHFG